jgi:hypothetical protein
MADPVTLLISVAISVGTSMLVSKNLKTPSQNDTGTKIKRTGTRASRNIPYGLARMQAVPVYKNVQDSNNANRLDIFSCGIGPVHAIRQVFVDEVAVITAADYTQDHTDPTSGRFSSGSLINGFEKQCELQIRQGHENDTYAQLGIDFGDGEWTTNHTGNRVVQVYLKSVRNIKDESIRIMGDSISVSVDVKGIELYDPRFHLSRNDRDYEHGGGVPVEYQQCGRNGALQILDFVTDSYYGMSIPDQYINFASFAAAATWLDDNQLRSDGMVDASASFAEIISTICESNGLIVTFEKGQLHCKYEGVEAIIETFDESNIIEGSLDITENSTTTYSNVVNVEFQDRELNHEQGIWTTPQDIYSDPRIIADGKIKETTLSLRMCAINGSESNDPNSHARVLGSREYNKSFYQKQVTFETDGNDYDLEIFDVIGITDVYRGWSNKPFRITELTRTTDEDNYNLLKISASEYDDSIYTGQKDGSSGNDKFPNRPPEVTAPTSLAFDLQDYTTDGYGTFSWVPTWFASGSTHVIDYKRTSDIAWTRLGETSNTEWKVARLQSDSYDFRVATRDPLQGLSPFTVLTPVVISPLGILPSVTGVTADFTGRNCEFSWDDMLPSSIGAPVGGPDTPLDRTVADIFSSYRVSIFDNLNNLLGVFNVGSNEYIFTWEQNVTKERTLHAEVQIVAIDGSTSTVDTTSEFTATNPQVATPVTNNYGKIGAIWFQFNPPTDSDWVGTEIHVSETSGFVPSDSTRVALLGNETLYVWYFPDGSLDTDVRYVKVGHYDAFGRDNINYSFEEVLGYNAIQNELEPFDPTDLENAISDNEQAISDLNRDISQYIPDVSGSLAQLRNANNAPVDDFNNPIQERINIVASTNKTETAGFGLFADNTGTSRMIVAADEFMIAGGKGSGNVDNDKRAFYFNSGDGKLYIDHATIVDLTADSIAAGTITANEIQAGTITALQIAANTITTNEIQAGTIQAADIEANTITTNQIASNTITAANIAGNTITGNEISSATTITAGSGNSVAKMSGTDTYGFWAGNATSSLAPFRVTRAGALTATSATITGAINAQSGTITGSVRVGTGTSSSNYVDILGGGTAGGNDSRWLRVQDGGAERVRWDYDGRLRMRNASGTDVVDFDPVTSTYTFRGTVQADQIIGDVVTALVHNNVAPQGRFGSTGNTTLFDTITINTPRPYTRDLVFMVKGVSDAGSANGSANGYVFTTSTNGSFVNYTSPLINSASDSFGNGGTNEQVVQCIVRIPANQSGTISIYGRHNSQNNTSASFTITSMTADTATNGDVVYSLFASGGDLS